MKNSKKDSFLPQYIPQPKLVRPRHIGRLVIILSVLSLTTFYCGYCLAYITALGTSNIATIYGQTSAIPAVKAFLISSLPYGVFIGTFFSPWIMPLASRRKLTLILAIIAQILEGIIQADNLTVFFVIRVFQGVITGIFMAFVPIYIRQISPKQINKKGIFGIFGQVFFILGFMGSFGVNTIFLKAHLDQFIRWRLVVSMNFLIMFTIIICIVTDFIPQSPNDLIKQGKIEKAKQVLALFHHQKFIDQLYEQKVKQVEDAKKPPEPPKKDRPIIKSILAFQIPVMHQFTGVNAYISQMGYVSGSFQNDFGDYVPFLMGAVQVVTLIYSTTYLYRIKRKTLVLIGNLAMGLCNFGIGILFIFINTHQYIFWLVVTLIVIFMGFNGATLVPGVGPYVAQIGTKPQIRWSGVGNWFATGTSVAVFILVGNYINYESIFLAYGIISVLLFIFNAIMMVDVKQNIKQKLNIELQNLDLNETSSSDKQSKEAQIENQVKI